MLKTVSRARCRPLTTRLLAPRKLSTRPVDHEDSKYDDIDIAKFREIAFTPARPLLLKSSTLSTAKLPASQSWFDGSASSESGPDSPWISLSQVVIDKFGQTLLPYELHTPSHLPHDKQNNGIVILSAFRDWLQAHHPHYLPFADFLTPKSTSLTRFHAPIHLFHCALTFNSRQPPTSRLTHLYIAQATLTDLPPAIQYDLPTPAIVSHAGKGDIYGSSLWLGLEPTYTPWHRDPNPNLFVQIYGEKEVRLAGPDDGEGLFRDVRRKMGGSIGGNARIRGEEMFGGEEAQLMEEAIWGTSGAGQDAESDVAQMDQRLLHTATVCPGDSLFVPKGWWHSVRSTRVAGELNASINWWFR